MKIEQRGHGMALNQLFQHYSIKNKDIYVVDDHHKALAAWALARRNLQDAPNLITIDHHTDTHEAFFRHTYWEGERNRTVNVAALRAHLVGQMNFNIDASVETAISMLEHDEHISAVASTSPRVP
jgi:hypothetical protein